MGTTGTQVSGVGGAIDDVVSKSTILTRVNQICKRAETDIDDILLEALYEISLRTGAVKALATGNTVADVGYVSQPADLAGKLVHSFHINDKKPLSEITWSQYLNNNISGYCLYNGRIYIRSTPASSDDVYYCKYSKIDDNVNSIELPNIFTESIVRLTAAKLFGKYQMYDDLEKQMVLYERALNINKSGQEPTPPVCVNNNWEG